jgi:hypothetical protein
MMTRKSFFFFNYLTYKYTQTYALTYTHMQTYFIYEYSMIVKGSKNTRDRAWWMRCNMHDDTPKQSILKYVQPTTNREKS